MTAPLTRRQALAGAATVGVTAPVLAACGDDTPGAERAPGTSTAPSSSSAPPSSAAPPSTTAPVAPGALVAAADVPVGGGVVIGSEEVVVTQPTAGQFKAFTAICTHQGCLVGSVSDGTISCPCHGSTFSASDGSPTGGPASGPLSEVPVKVARGQVTRA